MYQYRGKQNRVLQSLHPRRVNQEINKYIKWVTWQYGKDNTGSGERGAGRAGDAVLYRFISKGSSKRQHWSRELKVRKLSCARGEDLRILQSRRTNSKCKGPEAVRLRGEGRRGDGF